MNDNPNGSWCPSPKKRLGSEKAEEMSKRFFAACMAMQGILSKYNDTPVGSIVYLDEESAVIQAYKYADELLKQESND
jgi:hypothetical protein